MAKSTNNNVHYIENCRSTNTNPQKKPHRHESRCSRTQSNEKHRTQRLQKPEHGIFYRANIWWTMSNRGYVDVIYMSNKVVFFKKQKLFTLREHKGSGFLWGLYCSSFSFLCLLFVLFVSCTQCSPCLCIVYSWLPLRSSLTFIGASVL
jgi:hypothetical protein